MMEEDILLTERDQIRHAVTVANQKIRELDDSIGEREKRERKLCKQRGERVMEKPTELISAAQK